jgi:hypothetical protein
MLHHGADLPPHELALPQPKSSDLMRTPQAAVSTWASDPEALRAFVQRHGRRTAKMPQAHCANKSGM